MDPDVWHNLIVQTKLYIKYVKMYNTSHDKALESDDEIWTCVFTDLVTSTKTDYRKFYWNVQQQISKGGKKNLKETWGGQLHLKQTRGQFDLLQSTQPDRKQTSSRNDIEIVTLCSWICSERK